MSRDHHNRRSSSTTHLQYGGATELETINEDNIMTTLMKKLPLITLGLALFMNFFGCESNSPVAPESGTDTLKKSGSEITFLRSKVVRLQKNFNVTKTVKAEVGGLVKVGDQQSGFAGVTFPANSLAEDLDVSISWDSQKFEVEFGPHGSQFLAPVLMRISYKEADLAAAGVAEEDLRIWYYDETDGLWQLAGQTVNTQEKYVEGTTTHFSRYALGGE